jgi:hypothetical protein
LLAYSCLTLGVHLTMGLKLKPAETRVGYLIAMVTQTDLTVSMCPRCGFLLFQFSQNNSAYPKYPPQPVIGCDGYQRKL